MSYLHLLIMIAIVQGQRIVRRLVRAAVVPQPLDADIEGWLLIMTTCDDHNAITSYARSTFN